MANPTAGFGLRPIRRLDGAALSFQMITRRIAYNNAGTIGTGDLTQFLTDGFIDPYTAADAVVAGVFWGCTYLSAATGRVEWYPQWNAPTLPSTTIVTAFLIADPNILFEIRSSGGTVAVPNSDIGGNFEVTVGTVNAQSGQSTTTLLATSVATTATLPLRLWGQSQRITGGFNDNALVNNVVEVKLNTLPFNVALGLT